MEKSLHQRKYIFAVAIIAFLIAAAYWLLFPHGHHTPDVPPPDGSFNVRYYRDDGWQYHQYFYRLDNEPSVSKEFAKMLMIKSRGEDIPITEEPFEKFPISGNFPSWFTPNAIEDGTLITGANWIYAVVDNNSGRMYYYNGH